ncbi:MAG: hypothetical protein WBB67_03710, partial [bacterium]
TEVDFIYKRGKSMIPIEVKTRGRFHRGLANYMRRYKVQNGYIAHLGGFKKGRISTIPGFWLA